jgi:hypothetical protein
MINIKYLVVIFIVNMVIPSIFPINAELSTIGIK